MTPEPEPLTFARQPIQSTVNPGREAFKSLQPITTTTEKLRPEEELFNSVFQTNNNKNNIQTQFDDDDNVVSRPRTDPFLQRPLPPRIRPQSPRRLEPSNPVLVSRPKPSPVSRPPSPNLPIKELPRRPTIPNDPVRLGNRARQSLSSVVTPRTNPLIPRTTESSTPFPSVTLSQFPTAVPQSPRPIVPQRAPVVVPQSSPIVQPVQPVSRPRIPVRPPPPASSPVTPAPFEKINNNSPNFASYDYDYNYDENYDSSPALVPAIGDYDLNPLTSKVRIKMMYFSVANSYDFKKLLELAKLSSHVLILNCKRCTFLKMI